MGTCPTGPFSDVLGTYGDWQPPAGIHRVKDFGHHLFFDLKILSFKVLSISALVADLMLFAIGWSVSVRSSLEKRVKRVEVEKNLLKNHGTYRLVKRTQNQIREEHKGERLITAAEKFSSCITECEIKREGKRGICCGISLDIARRILCKEHKLDRVIKKFSHKGAPCSAAILHAVYMKSLKGIDLNDVLTQERALGTEAFDEWSRKNKILDEINACNLVLQEFGLQMQEETGGIESLSIGFYKVDLCYPLQPKDFFSVDCKPFLDHAITYIKSSSEKGVVVDPNYGFFMCSTPTDAKKVISTLQRLRYPELTVMDIFSISKISAS